MSRWVEFGSAYPFELTKNNHLGYEFFGRHSGYHPENSLLVRFGELTASVKSGFEEAQNVAQCIVKNFTEPLTLFLSGGVDSEAMAQAFLAAGVPFHIVIARYNRGLNDFDIEWAIQFCREKNLNYELLEIDLDEFFESGRHAFLADRYRCRSPQFTVHFEMMLKTKGVALMPWQPPGVGVTAGKKIVLGFPEDHYFSYYRFFITEQKPGVPFFFLYTPELIASFLRTPTMNNILFNGKQKWLDYDLKLQIYKESGFDLRRRPDKWTGFEKVKEYFASKHNSHLGLFDELYRKPLMVKYPVSRKYFHRIPKSYFLFKEKDEEQNLDLQL